MDIGRPQSPKKPSHQYGKTFVQAIEALKRGERADAFTYVTTLVRSNKDKPSIDKEVGRSASFHTSIRVNGESESASESEGESKKRVFVQGMLTTTNNRTSYYGYDDNEFSFNVMPEHLSSGRATVEGRFLKRMFNDVTSDVTFKKDSIPEVSNNELAYVGGIAFGSVVEDITAKRAFNFEGVGSAIRAELMARKWDMKKSGETSSEGYGVDQLKKFPQLGSKKLPSSLYGDQRGASYLLDEIIKYKDKMKEFTESEEPKVTKKVKPNSAFEPLEHHLGEEGSIYQAHERARKAAIERFTQKFDKNKDEKITRGFWKNVNHNDYLEQDKKLFLQNEYVDAKLRRHGINPHFKAQDKNLYELPIEPTALRGSNFLQAIKNIAENTNNDKNEVFTRFDVDKITKSATYGALSRTSKKNKNGDDKTWTQGIMEPSQNTAYFGDSKTNYKAIPNEININRARFESRAMKYLSDENYSTRPKEIKSYFPHEINDAGTIALGSFVEDITGQRALGLRDTGSAMRAKTMAAKWNMLSEGGKSESFGPKLLKALPQLGKSTWQNKSKKSNSKRNAGIKLEYGASKLFTQMQTVDGRNFVEASHIGLASNLGTIPQAHLDAQNAASKRFDEKFKAINPENSSSLQGWWGRNKDTINTALEDNTKVEPLREQYIARKMQRHGISTYDERGVRTKGFGD